jgi:hypothetical protein
VKSEETAKKERPGFKTNQHVYKKAKRKYHPGSHRFHFQWIKLAQMGKQGPGGENYDAV